MGVGRVADLSPDVEMRRMGGGEPNDKHNETNRHTITTQEEEQRPSSSILRTRPSSSLHTSEVASSDPTPPPQPQSVHTHTVRVEPHNDTDTDDDPPPAATAALSTRRVSFARTTYRRSSKLFVCYRRFCRFCCCSSSRPRRTPIEPIRYVNEAGVEIIESNQTQRQHQQKLEEEYDEDDSFYSYDNDPNEHQVTECHRFWRREFSGVKLRHWVYLSIVFLIGVGLSIYLWIWFDALSQDRLEDRFGKLCQDRIILGSTVLDQTAKVAALTGEVIEHLQATSKLSHLTVEATDALRWHLFYDTFESLDPSKFNNVRSGIAIAAVVTHSQRTTFELIHGRSILSFDTSTGSLITAPNASFYIPILVTLGQSLTKMVDLVSIPYFLDLSLKMRQTARTQFATPFYVEDYAASVGPDGDVTRRIQNTIIRGELSSNSGYRAFSLTPIQLRNLSDTNFTRLTTIDGRSQLDVNHLNGLVVSTWDLTHWLHMSYGATNADLDAVIELYATPEPSEIDTNARILHGYERSTTLRSQHFNTYFMDHPFDGSQYSNVPYTDADTLDLSLDQSVAFAAPLSNLLAYGGLSWTGRCVPTSSYTHSNREWTANVIGATTIAAVTIFSVFIFFQLRALTAKEREVRFKNQVLTELQVEREKAEDAGHSKTDFMAFLCHELRNPLHAVLSMSDALKETQLDPDQSESVYTIHGSSELMLAIVNDILDLSKIEAGRIELETLPVDVTALISSLVRGNRSWAAEKGVTVVGRIDPRISASVKFTPKHGTVTVQVSLDDSDSNPTTKGQTGGGLIELPTGAGRGGRGGGGGGGGGLGLHTLSEYGNGPNSVGPSPFPLHEGASPSGNTSMNLNFPFSYGAAGVAGHGVAIDAIPNSIQSAIPPSSSAIPSDLPPTSSPSEPSAIQQQQQQQPQPSHQSLQSSPITATTSISQPTTPATKTQTTPPAPLSALPARLNMHRQSKVLFLHPRVPSVDTVSISPPSTPPPMQRISSLESEGGGVSSVHAPGGVYFGHIGGGFAGGSSSVLHDVSPLTSYRGMVSRDLDSPGPTPMPNTPLLTGKGVSSSSRAAGAGAGAGVGGAKPPVTVSSKTTSPVLSGISVAMPRPKRLTATAMSPLGTPLFGPSSPLIHAPAALHATLPLLLLNRHRRDQSSNNSPRLFGTPQQQQQQQQTTTTQPQQQQPPDHSPHPLSQGTFVSSSPPNRPKQLVASDASNSSGSGNSVVGVGGGVMVGLNSVVGVPPIGVLPGQATMNSSSPCPTPNGGQDRYSISSRIGGTGKNTNLPTTTTATTMTTNAPPPTTTHLSPVVQLSEEVEEFSRTHGQLGSVRLTFTVQDTGIGIPPEYMDALFEPYSQAKRSITRSHGGTGLGLAIVKRLGDLMSGEITVESEIGIGSSFSFSADFLVAKVPTPAMASMLRHIQPQDGEIGQVRYSNYTTLKIATDEEDDRPNRHHQHHHHMSSLTSHPSPPAPPPSVSLAGTGAFPSPFLPNSSPPPPSPNPNGGNAGTNISVHELKDLASITRERRNNNNNNNTNNGIHHPSSSTPNVGHYVNLPGVISDDSPIGGTLPSSQFYLPHSSLTISVPPRHHSLDGTNDTNIPIQSIRSAPPPASAATPAPTMMTPSPSPSPGSSPPQPHSHPPLSTHHSAGSAVSNRRAFAPPVTPLNLRPDDDEAANRVSDMVVPLTRSPLTGDSISSHNSGSSPATGFVSSPNPSDGVIVTTFDDSNRSAMVAPLNISHTHTPSPTTPTMTAAAATAAAATLSKPFILVVDDAAINRKILLKMLGNDYQIDQAENGLQAVELVDANPGKYCVVLMDLMMPVMGGTEAMQQIRSRGHTTLPVIAVTANTMNEDIDKCLSIGFTSFLSKPCRKETVRQMVKQYVTITPNTPTPMTPLSPIAASPSTKRKSTVQRRVLPPQQQQHHQQQQHQQQQTTILNNANGQIVASLSPLPPGVHGAVSDNRIHHRFPSSSSSPLKQHDVGGWPRPASPVVGTGVVNTVAGGLSPIPMQLYPITSASSSPNLTMRLLDSSTDEHESNHSSTSPSQQSPLQRPAHIPSVRRPSLTVAVHGKTIGAGGDTNMAHHSNLANPPRHQRSTSRSNITINPPPQAQTTPTPTPPTTLGASPTVTGETVGSLSLTTNNTAVTVGIPR